MSIHLDRVPAFDRRIELVKQYRAVHALDANARDKNEASKRPLSHAIQRDREIWRKRVWECISLSVIAGLSVSDMISVAQGCVSLSDIC